MPPDQADQDQPDPTHSGAVRRDGGASLVASILVLVWRLSLALGSRSQRVKVVVVVVCLLLVRIQRESVHLSLCVFIRLVKA